jgi:hypothetical protein
MSDYAYEIVDAIYAGDKASALDAVADALKAKAVDAIQTKKIERIPVVLYGKEFWNPLINFFVFERMI